MSVQVGLCRVMSGQVGRKNFPGRFLPLRFCISFFVSGADSRHWQHHHDSLTDARLTPVGWRLRAACRVWTVHVGSKRAMSGQVGQLYFFWTYALDCAQVSSLSLLAYGQIDCRQFRVLHWPSLAFRFPASGRHGLIMKARLPEMPVRILAQGYYITVLDAIALPDRGIVRCCVVQHRRVISMSAHQMPCRWTRA